MNEFLAELYDTPQGGATSEDMEKQAAIELVTKVAQVEGIEEPNEAQITYILENAEHYQAELDKLAAAGGGEVDENGLTQEDWDKLAEADIIGRTMAHAFTDEKGEIEKAADAKELGLRVLRGAGRGLAHAGEATGVSSIIRGLKGRAALKPTKEMLAKAKGKHPMSLAAGDVEKARKAMKAPTDELKGGLKRLGKRSGAAGVGALAGYGGYKAVTSADERFEAEAWALAQAVADKTAGVDYDELVAQRAVEILEENGYTVE